MLRENPEKVSCLEWKVSHCLHAEDVTHAVYAGRHARHVDDYCCHCGQSFCYTKRMLSPEEHGPHLKK